MLLKSIKLFKMTGTKIASHRFILGMVELTSAALKACYINVTNERFHIFMRGEVVPRDLLRGNVNLHQFLIIFILRVLSC